MSRGMMEGRAGRLGGVAKYCPRALQQTLALLFSCLETNLSLPLCLHCHLQRAPGIDTACMLARSTLQRAIRDCCSCWLAATSSEHYVSVVVHACSQQLAASTCASAKQALLAALFVGPSCSARGMAEPFVLRRGRVVVEHVIH